jgi:hypothetical protein
MGGSEVREGGLREVEDGAPMVCARKRRELRWAAVASRARDRETLPDRVTAGTETPCCPADTPRMRPGAWSPNKKKLFPWEDWARGFLGQGFYRDPPGILGCQSGPIVPGQQRVRKDHN